MKILITVVFNFIFSLIFAQFSRLIMYVDPVNGNDKYDGTCVSYSFKTVHKAQDKIRKINKSKYEAIIVYLRGGIYQIEKTLLFKEVDGGSDGCKIIYKNYKYETPVLTGGVFLKNWELYDVNKNIYRTHFDSQSIRQLYINGKRAIRARQPNVNQTHTILEYIKKDAIIKFKKNEVALWENKNHVEIVTINQFTSNHLRIESISIDSQSIAIKIQHPEDSLLKKIAEPFTWKYYWFENAYEFIDSEGEWYQNQSDGYIYYKPFTFQDMKKIEAVVPCLETIIKIEGSDLKHPVQQIQFYGISFMHTSWLWPNDNGCVEFQAFHPFCIRQHPDSNDSSQNGSEYNFSAPSGIYLAKANFVTFERCIFEHMGANGIKLEYATHHCKIIGNVIHDISGNGIYEMMPGYYCSSSMAKYLPEDLNEVCSFDLIANNYISHCGQDYKGAVGIFCGYTKNITISHNEICNLPYSGVSVGWGWGGLTDKSVMYDNKITSNYIHHVNTEAIMYDGGAIYTLGDQPKSKCDSNYCVSTCRGLFFDEGTGHYNATANVVDAGLEWVAIWNANQHDILINNNYTNSNVIDNKGTNCNITNTHLVTQRRWPKEALKIIKNAGIKSNFIAIKKYLLQK